MSKHSISPVLLHPSDSVKVLQPLPKVHSRFDEAFLQDILAKHPELLPVSAIRADVGSLVCVGRETSLPSGSVDNLYLSTSGYPVLVETKLWRNPQARRVVLSQTLEYIKDITKKDFDWFQEQWRAWQGDHSQERSLLDEISDVGERNGENIDEVEFIDRVNRALAGGNLLALIVGDGVETRLQELVDELCKHSAHLRYVLALCELAFFELGAIAPDGMIVVPRIVGNIEPVERAYIRVDVAEGLKQDLTVSPVIDPSPDPRPGRVNLSSEEFYLKVEKAIGAKMRNQMENAAEDLIQSCGLEPDFKAAAIMLKLPDIEGEAPGASLIAFEKEGRVYNTNHMYGQLSRWEQLGPEEADKITKEYWKALHEIDCRFAIEGMNHNAWKSFILFSEIQPKWEQIRKCILDVVAKIRSIASESRQ